VGFAGVWGMFYLLLPLIAASLYTLSSLFFKKGYQQGATAMQAFHWANLGGLFLLGGTVFLGQGMAWSEIWKPLLVAAMIYAGALATFAAIRAGDVSLITPLLGAKVVLVALATPLLTGSRLGWQVWVACVLTAVGIFLTGKKDIEKHRGAVKAMLLCFLSCLFFGVSDVMIQAWAKALGGYTFLGALPIMVGLYSALHVVIWQRNGLAVPKAARASVAWGTVLLAVQGIMMGTALGFFDDAARVNVVYGSRGLWSLVMVWYLGRFFGNTESTTSRDAFLWRLAGCIIVLAAIALAML
jgi:uncharacterized membrane protein